MTTGKARNRRIAEQIQKDLSEIIRLRLKDPRVGMVTLTFVEVTEDNAHAKIYVSSLLGEASLAKSLEGLLESRGFLRRELGKALSLRVIPELHFIRDEAIDRGTRMGALIDEALQSDAALQDKAGD